jgi:hypothetical protein
MPTQARATLAGVCRVCLKRPEIPEERHGRCEACVAAGRVAFRFRVAGTPGDKLVVKAGELSPRALRQRWHGPLTGWRGRAAVRPHLGLHELELVTARERVESVRLAADLAAREAEVIDALRHASERTDAAW